MDAVWRWAGARREYPRVTDTVKSDICVVGAGIAGLLTAYRLLEDGMTVAVVDRDEPGRGETLNTTAHVSYILDWRYHDLARLHGESEAIEATRSHARAIGWLEGLAAGAPGRCGWQPVNGYLIGPAATVQEEMEFLRRAGLHDVQRTESPLTAFGNQSCLRVPNQAQLDPTQLVEWLLEKIEQMGAQIFARTPITKIEEADGGWYALGDGGEGILAKEIVTATNSPVLSSASVHLKQTSYRTYVVGLPYEGSLHDTLVWDCEDPYHYVRMLDKDGERYLLVGGEDHVTGQEQDGDRRYSSLALWAREHFPDVGAPEFCWSGQVLEPIDGLAYIGAFGEPGRYIATGFSGNGMTYGAISAMLLGDLIAQRKNAWADLYEPARLRWQAIPELAKNGLNMTAQYSDWIAGGDITNEDQISAGSGAVVRDGLRKLAVFQAGFGVSCRLSAVCPHMGGIVRWNPTEKTWDCPCHGSRFDPFGKVINGPAAHDLAPVRESS